MLFPRVSVFTTPALSFGYFGNVRKGSPDDRESRVLREGLLENVSFPFSSFLFLFCLLPCGKLQKHFLGKNLLFLYNIVQHHFPTSTSIPSVNLNCLALIQMDQPIFGNNALTIINVFLSLISIYLWLTLQKNVCKCACVCMVTAVLTFTTHLMSALAFNPCGSVISAIKAFPKSVENDIKKLSINQNFIETSLFEANTPYKLLIVLYIRDVVLERKYSGLWFLLLLPCPNMIKFFFYFND